MYHVNFSFPDDHTYVVNSDIYHRVPMHGRVFSFPVHVTKSDDECFGVGAEVRGISRDPEEVLYHEPWRRLLVEGYFSPPASCSGSIHDIRFCWVVNRAPYVSW